MYIYKYIYIYHLLSQVCTVYVYIFLIIIYTGFSNLSELYGQPSYGMENKLMFTSLSSGIIWVIWYGEQIHVDIHVMSWSVGGQWRRSMTWCKHVQSNARSEKHMKTAPGESIDCSKRSHHANICIYTYIHIMDTWLFFTSIHMCTLVNA